MYVERLGLTDFRNYATAEVALGAGVSVFTGPNGQGKTNLVEAVEYLATLSSHRVAGDVPLVRVGTAQAIVRALVVAGVDDPRTLLLEAEINLGRPNRARVNRAPQRSPRDLLGGLRVVTFAPDDLALVQGDPAGRRAFLDALVAARWPRLAGVQADYDRALRQRNALVKSLAGRGGRLTEEAAASLDVWSEHLAGHGAEVMRARLATLSALTPYVAQAYADIAPANDRADAAYQTRSPLGDCPADAEPADQTEALRVGLLDLMAQRRADELRRGVSLVGPHRDDVVLSLGDLPARGYASHGEGWSLALALRLGAFALLRADGTVPVLILDDVFAELDAIRRSRLARTVLGAEQILVTAAVAADVPDDLRGRAFRVDSGTVIQVSTSGDDVGPGPDAEAVSPDA